MRFQALIIASLCFISQLAFAAVDLEAHHFTLKPRYLHVSGYVDGSYNYLLQNKRFISGTNDRVFDLNENGFTLHQASFFLSKIPEQGLGGLMNVVIGRDAIQLAPNGINPHVFGLQNFGLVIPQAYLTYNHERFVIKAGEMLTLAGIEFYDYTQDKNFSRSILDGYAEPGVHVGLRGIGKLTPHLSLIAGLINGWNTVAQPGRLKTMELALSYVVPQRFSLMVDEYYGQQPLNDHLEGGPMGHRHLFDVFGTLFLNPKLSISANYDFGIQTKAAVPAGNITRASWQGLTGYINYLWTDKLRTTLRAETFNDGKGFRTGVRQNWREMTLTLAYLALKEVELRAETRHDFSNVKSFLRKSGVGASNNQQSFSLEALYKF